MSPSEKLLRRKAAEAWKHEIIYRQVLEYERRAIEAMEVEEEEIQKVVYASSEGCSRGYDVLTELRWQDSRSATMNDAPLRVLRARQKKLNNFSAEDDRLPHETSPSPYQACDSSIRNDSSDTWGFGAPSLHEE